MTQRGLERICISKSPDVMATELAIAIHLLSLGVKSQKMSVGLIFLNCFSLQIRTCYFSIKTACFNISHCRCPQEMW